MREDADPKCSSCAYRVHECVSRSSSEMRFSMICLHPMVGRQPCASVRIPAGSVCGDAAALWTPRATVGRANPITTGGAS